MSKQQAREYIERAYGFAKELPKDQPGRRRILMALSAASTQLDPWYVKVAGWPRAVKRRRALKRLLEMDYGDWAEDTD